MTYLCWFIFFNDTFLILTELLGRQGINQQKFMHDQVGTFCWLKVGKWKIFRTKETSFRRFCDCF